MTIVRLYRKIKHHDGKETKKYVSQKYMKNKKTGDPQIQETNNRDMAMIFKTTEEIVQFHFVFATQINRLGSKLLLEKEEIDKTFEEVFGVDVNAEVKADLIEMLIDKDKLEADILLLTRKLDTLYSINMRELIPQAQEEVKHTISLLETELGIKNDSLKKLMEAE